MNTIFIKKIMKTSNKLLLGLLAFIILAITVSVIIFAGIIH